MRYIVAPIYSVTNPRYEIRAEVIRVAEHEFAVYICDERTGSPLPERPIYPDINTAAEHARQFAGY